jgi:hypothetical protein
MTPYVLILTIFGMTSQTGQAVTTQQFTGKAACMAAAEAWLASIPRERDGKYYAGQFYPRAVCVPK